jgi:uncharacterized membrane protein
MRCRLWSILVVWALSLGVVLLGGPSTTWSHRRHHDKSKAPEASQEAEDRSTGASPTSERLERTAPSGAARVPQSPKAGIPWRQHVWAHMHNKIVHFPIALGLMGAVLTLLSRRWSHYGAAARLLIVVAALFALAAYFSGRDQEEPFKGSELKEVLEWHERLGVATTVLLWLGVVISWAPPARRWLWVWALLILVLIPATGFFGGILAHAE